MTTDPIETSSENGLSKRLFVLAPLAFFLILSGVFLYALQSGDPNKVPSALIGKPVPEFDLPAVENLVRGDVPVPGFATSALKQGSVSVVNVWASWCIPCRAEHPFLEDLARTGDVTLFGINYKDGAANARRFLGQLGNPYRAVGADNTGRTSIDWGVYGVPETYVVDGSGRIVYKHVGPITEKVLADLLLPAIRRAGEKSAPAGS